MSLEVVKAKINRLSAEERRQFAERTVELEWDRQIEVDFSPGGRGMPLLAELEQELSEGKTRPIEKVCAERRSRNR
ncbi:MAG: hypothetical protein FJW38_00650 [Acidobacteria bacterium]|nr:hypothetical protein [Acidobacteriota bacterium]